MGFRTVDKIVVGREQPEGDGARVIRSVGSASLPNLDPFLLLDELRIRKPAGFPDHPHRGMQTVTYVLEGGVRHEDNKGHVGIIGPGDVQWMTAGRGIVHSEMPEGDNPGHGLQLWVNLSKANKMTEPQYQELRSSEIPSAKSKDGRVDVKIIAGKCFGVESPVFTQTPSMYWDVTMSTNSTFQEKIPIDYNTFIYVLSGTVRVGDQGHVGKHGSCIVFAMDESADSIRMTSDEGARFIAVAGKPLNEPIVQHGPFVMNTQEEILQAFRDFAANKF